MTDRMNLSILLLDDDPFMLGLLDSMLKGLGYRNISGFESGVDALAHCEGQVPDVILLDINMPDMDGVEFVRHLGQRHSTCSLILISGERERMLEATHKLALAHHLVVLGTLHKPATTSGLSGLLDKWVPAKIAAAAAFVKNYTAAELRTAICNGELVNYYQPKVAVSTGEVIGVETLVRWQHPVDGIVFPDRFITLAEEHGLIGDLTRCVLSQALEQAAIWQRSGINLRVAINVSMDDIADLGFADYVNAETMRAGVMPVSLVLEVTESRLMQQLTTSLDVLTRLSLKRFGLSIDDFGTGHSSLAQLRDLPFDELKIDQSFTHDAWQNPRLRSLFDASLSLARELGIEVVAEGVEDAEDWAFLQTRHCDIAQGYYIARPLPASALQGWMNQWRERLQAITENRKLS